MPAAPSTRPLTTNGWDTVYAVYFPDVNRAIVAQKSSPDTLTETGQDDNGPYSLTGSFGPWQLVGGGDAENLHLQVPLITSTLVYAGETAVCPTPVQLTVEVQLAWVAADATGNRQNLTVAAGAGPATPVVLVGEPDFGTNPLSLTQGALYQQLVVKWLTAHVGAFQHVFSSLTLNTVLDQSPGFQWTVPTATLYAVADQPVDTTGAIDGSRSIFAVLCMTENRPSPGVHQVDPAAIPPGDGITPVNSAFLISPERFLSNMILPGLPLMFRGTPGLDSFTLSADGRSLTNAVELQFTDQQLDNGNTVNPTVSANNFIVAMLGDVVQLTMNGLHFEYLSGTTIAIDHTSTVKLTLNNQGQFKMDMVQATNSATVSQSNGVYIGTIVASIAAAFAAAAVGGLIGGVASAATVAPVAAGAADVELAVINGIEQEAADGLGNFVPAQGAEDGAGEGAVAALQQLPARFNSFFAARWRMILGILAKSIVSGAPASINYLIKYMALKDGSDMPTLDAFGTQVMTPITWPALQTPSSGAGTLGDALVAGALNGPFQVALNLQVTPTSAAQAV